MSFARPELLWLFAIVPVLTIFMVWAWRKKQWAIRQFVQTRLLENLTVGTSGTRQKVKISLLLVSVSLIVFAVARPQWGYQWDEAKQRGLDIIVAIDSSRSMATKDVRPDRLERAKLAALDLMSLAKSDRVGLVTFAGTAFLQCPLTFDDSAFSQSVRAVSTNIIPMGGTAFGETIEVALDAFKDEGDNYKILVIFTDGENHEPGALEAAQKAADDGMRIFTVGVGSPQGGMIEVGQRGGQIAFLKDNQGNVVKSRLNEELLQQIATTANGFYLNLSGAAAIETLYVRGLAPLPKSEISSRLVRRFFERFYWPLCLAIVFLMIEMFIPDQRRSGRRKTGGQAVALGFLLLFSPSAQAASAPSASSAMRQYHNGDYASALEQYQVLKDKSPDDARIDYNAGAAAYRAKDFDAAARSFSAALASEDAKLSQSAWYNLGNTFFQLGKNETDDKKRMDTWKNALNLYDNALRENPEDPDARHNRGFVNYQLEQLKQQQQEQEGDGSDEEDGEQGDEEEQGDDSKEQDKNQDGEGDQKDGEENQDSKGDEKKDGSEDSKNEDNKDGKDGEEKDGEPSEPGEDEKDGKDQQPQPKPGEEGEEGEESDEEKKARQAKALGKMTPEDAKRLLNARMGKARPLIFLPPQKKGDGERRTIEKKW
jgi:Ca-activated chloride channel homolog